MDSDLKEKIKAYIDESYDEKIKELQELKNKYSLQIDHNQYEGLGIDDRIGILETTYKTNLQEIENKIKEPSQNFELEKTKTLIDEINGIINKKNDEINVFNEKIKHKKSSIQDNRSKAWGYFYLKYEGDIKGYEKKLKELENKENNAKVIKNIVQGDITKLEGKIKDLQKNIKNMD